MVAPKDLRRILPTEILLWDILESVTDAVVTIDEDHKVLVCNKAAEEMFGYTCDEMLGKDLSPFIPDSHRHVHKGYVQRYLDTGIPRIIGKARECSVRRRNGEYCPVEISYSVSRSGGNTYFTAIIRDISERKAMEREIRFMEKLADIGKAVTHIVHEIRKPLMLIGGFARQLLSHDNLHPEEMAQKKLSIIVEEVRRLETLLNGIRLLTRPRASSQKHSLAINEVVRETLDLLDPMLQDQEIELLVQLGQGPMTVQGDSDQLKQVFLNILQNAVEALNGKGKIRVLSRMMEGTVQVVIEDDGPGIPKWVQEKIFDPFFSTKPEGTGLGMAISQDILKDHEGSITLRSSPPHGTTFTVELPLEKG